MPLALPSTAALSGDIRALLGAAKTARGVAARRHACDLLERALLCADPGAVSEAQRTAARKLGVDGAACEDSLIEVPPHAVLVPLAIESLGVGLVRSMRIAFDLSSHDGYRLGLDASAARAVSEALEQAANYVGRHAPDRGYCLATVHPDALAILGPGALVDGPSLGAAAFVSAVSLWSERAVLPGTLVTGKLVGRQILPVGAIDAKLSTCAVERADMRRAVVPKAMFRQAQRALARRSIELLAVETTEELVAATLESTPRPSAAARHRVAELRRNFERGWYGFGWENVREHAERLLTVLREPDVELRVDVLGMLGAAEDHLGSPIRALEIFEQAVAICESGTGKRWVPDAPRSRLYQHLANTYRRVRRLPEARRAAIQAVSDAKRGRLRDELFKSYGCAGLVEWTAGRSEAAVAAFDRVLSLVHEHAPSSRVRTHAYLIDAFALAGDAARVREQFEIATKHLAQIPSANKQSAEAWLRTSYGAALFQLDEARAAVRAMDVPAVHEAIERVPLPGLWARRHLGSSLLALGRIDEGQALLGASPHAYGVLPGPNLLFSAHLNVLCETRGLLAQGAWDRDIGGRACRVLERFPEYLRHGAIERARVRALRAIASMQKPRDPAIRALSTIITLCGRIA